MSCPSEIEAQLILARCSKPISQQLSVVCFDIWNLLEDKNFLYFVSDWGSLHSQVQGSRRHQQLWRLRRGTASYLFHGKMRQGVRRLLKTSFSSCKAPRARASAATLLQTTPCKAPSPPLNFVKKMQQAWERDDCVTGVKKISQNMLRTSLWKMSSLLCCQSSTNQDKPENTEHSTHTHTKS